MTSDSVTWQTTQPVPVRHRRRAVTRSSSPPRPDLLYRRRRHLHRQTPPVPGRPSCRTPHGSRVGLSPVTEATVGLLPVTEATVGLSPVTEATVGLLPVTEATTPTSHRSTRRRYAVNPPTHASASSRTRRLVVTARCRPIVPTQSGGLSGTSSQSY